ncbi:MAG: hypothetical protein KGJ58_00750 [Patescibacteria group bacterium]|nr:hypothetical protein [Patescibacteria group bacterium]MDE1988152.1 hypothetical protein [Patescibacteria group bacterium]MDE2217972.1 hypothetical protein [Patescibacteria group bacterium]
MMKRIIIDALLFLAILLLPPLAPLIVAFFLSYYFESFYEIIFVGIFIDSLYGRSLSGFYDFSHLATFISAVLFVLSIFAKKRLKFHSDR